MFEFHTDKKRYFDMQVENTREYVIPFIEEYKKIVPNTRVLEIGCGEAGVLKSFIDKGCTGIGVELEEYRLTFAREYLSEEIKQNKIQFFSKDIYTVDIQQEFHGGFDIIILKDVIEHIHDQRKLIAWMKDFLNPKGVIFFGFPPWQMPFGGHQQIAQNKIVSKIPYTHLLPMPLYKAYLKLFKEKHIEGLVEIKETGISIERFERIVKQEHYNIVNKKHYLFNPIYKYKFGVKARKQAAIISHVKYARNFITTCVYYLIQKEK